MLRRVLTLLLPSAPTTLELPALESTPAGPALNMLTIIKSPTGTAALPQSKPRQTASRTQHVPMSQTSHGFGGCAQTSAGRAVLVRRVRPRQPRRAPRLRHRPCCWPARRHSRLRSRLPGKQYSVTGDLTPGKKIRLTKTTDGAEDDYPGTACCSRAIKSSSKTNSGDKG